LPGCRCHCIRSGQILPGVSGAATDRRQPPRNALGWLHLSSAQFSGMVWP
jgi:hypothetical protein